MSDDAPEAMLAIATYLSSASSLEEREAATQRAEAAALRVATNFTVRVQSSDQEQRVNVALELARWVENAFGEEAVALGKELRKTGALNFVLRMLYEAERTFVCVGLMLVTNLVCLEFDPPGAIHTSKQVLKADVFQKLKDLCLSDDSVVVGHACACLQNLCRDAAFAKLVLRFEMEAELNKLVRESDDEYVQQCAAGALSNTVEAIQREALASSLSRVDVALSASGQQPEGSRSARTHQLHACMVAHCLPCPVCATGQQPRRKSLGALSLFAHAFGEKPPTDIELEEEVLEALARAEAALLRENAERDEAAKFIQGVVRSRRSNRGFRMLMRLAAVTKVVVRWTRRRRLRRRRRAAYTIQAHARAYMCASRGICPYDTMLCIIDGLHRIHLRAVCRQVYTRYPGLQPPNVTLPALPGSVRRKWLQRFRAPFRAFRWSTAFGRMHGRTPQTKLDQAVAVTPLVPRQRIRPIGLLRAPGAAMVERYASAGAPVAPAAHNLDHPPGLPLATSTSGAQAERGASSDYPPGLPLTTLGAQAELAEAALSDRKPDVRIRAAEPERVAVASEL